MGKGSSTASGRGCMVVRRARGLTGHHITYRLLATTVVVTHATFVLFVVLGGLLVWRWRRVVWLHAPAVLWGVLVEVADLACPLTPVESWLRARAGSAGYAGGFIDHYLVPVLYPAALTRTMQFVLGGVAIVVNVLIYLRLVRLGIRREGAKLLSH